MDGIISQIIDGTLHPGDKLPTEMELCKQFGAGPQLGAGSCEKLSLRHPVHQGADGTFVSENYNQKMLTRCCTASSCRRTAGRNSVELRSVIDIGTLNIVIQRNDITSFCRTCTAPSGELRRNALAGAFGGQGAGAGQPVPHPDRQCGPEPHAGHHHRVYSKDASRLETTRKVLAKGEEEIERFVELHRQLLSVIERTAGGRDRRHSAGSLHLLEEVSIQASCLP